jgi:hypothetical protein
MWRCTDLPHFLRPDSEPIPQCLFFQKYCDEELKCVFFFTEGATLSEFIGLFSCFQKGPLVLDSFK